jgi:hypothetical protein
MFIIFVFQFYVLHSSSYSGFLHSVSAFFRQNGSTTLSKISFNTTTTTPRPVVIFMNNRMAVYRLATKFGDIPYGASDQGQAKLLEELHLYEVCQRDPSTIVVDVGAGLGRIIKYISVSKKKTFFSRRFWYVCSSMWLYCLYV